MDENYLENSGSIMQKNPEIGALGGRIEAVFEDGCPAWWEDFRHAYAVGKQAENPGVITTRNYVWGAGMVARKSLLQWIFNDQVPFLLADRKENELGSGGDSEICARVLLMDYKLGYDERLLLHHYIPKKRLTIEYRDKLLEGQASAQEILDEYDRLVHFGRLKTPTKITLTLIYSRRLFFGQFGSQVNEDLLKANISYMWGRNFWNEKGPRADLLRVRNYLVKNKTKNLLPA
jgi:hypothetical protein